MYKPSNQDLSENPPTPEHLLRGFHGRPVQRRQSVVLPLTPQDLANAQLLGRSDVIFYVSDKRDPNDPYGEGQQGYMKRFYHEQTPESYFFAVAPAGGLDDFQKGLVAQCKSSGLRSRVKKKSLFPKGPMPQDVVELSVLEKLDLSIGKSKFELHFEGYRLCVWDDMRTLMALPMSANPNPFLLDSTIYIWSSHHTYVNWRGIIK